MAKKKKVKTTKLRQFEASFIFEQQYTMGIEAENIEDAIHKAESLDITSVQSEGDLVGEELSMGVEIST